MGADGIRAQSLPARNVPGKSAGNRHDTTETGTATPVEHTMNSEDRRTLTTNLELSVLRLQDAVRWMKKGNIGEDTIAALMECKHWVDLAIERCKKG
jgi:hypothetical protein